MALERKLLAVPAQTFTTTGTSDGQITIAKPGLFKARQFVFVGAPSQPTLELEVKRIALGIIFLGPRDNNPETRTNLSAYPSGMGFIFANEQTRPFIPKDEVIPNYRLEDYEHEEEPTVARRSILVDAEGEKIDVIVTSGVRRLAVDLGAQVTVTTSGVQDVNVVNSPTVGVAGVVQVSGVVSFQRPVDVRVIEQPPSTATISGIITTSGIAEQPVRIDQVVKISGVVDFQRPVEVIVTNQTSGTTTVSGVVLVSGVDMRVQGMAPDNSPHVGFPVRIGARVETELNSGFIEKGDVVDVISDEYRRVYVNDSANIGIISTSSGIVTEARPILAKQLPGRKKIQIQNLGSVPIYIGGVGVSSGMNLNGGLRILPNGTNTLDAGDKINIFAIASSGIQDVRILELG